MNFLREKKKNYGRISIRPKVEGFLHYKNKIYDRGETRYKVVNFFIRQKV